MKKLFCFLLYASITHAIDQACHAGGEKKTCCENYGWGPTCWRDSSNCLTSSYDSGGTCTALASQTTYDCSEADLLQVKTISSRYTNGDLAFNHGTGVHRVNNWLGEFFSDKSGSYCGYLGCRLLADDGSGVFDDDLLPVDLGLSVDYRGKIEMNTDDDT